MWHFLSLLVAMDIIMPYCLRYRSWSTMLLANTEREAHVLSVADYIVKRKCKFLTGYINSQNSLCNLLCRTAQKDLSDMTL